MLRVPADSYKIVTTARKPSDNLRVLAAARALPKQSLIVLAMGELGFPTRVLSPVFGGLYTYAAPMQAEGTAAGQVSARSLRHLYRVEKLAKSAKVYGVIADPIRHSISPAVHNRAFQSRRVDAVYLPFLVAPIYLRDFFSLADRLPVATWTRWTRWPSGSAPSTRCGGKPESGAARIPTRRASPGRSRACCGCRSRPC
jgi:3-dehydroquinate dehydratase/shikimate dehydrogenase